MENSKQKKVEVSKDSDGVSQVLIHNGTICGNVCALDQEFKENVKKIIFTKSEFCNFPKAHPLLDYLPHLESLRIEHSKLKRINSWDLEGFGQLVDLILENNDIEELPADLFVHTPNLQRISFASNKIRIIDEKILEPLKFLKSFNLCFNPSIDVCYHHQATFDSVTLEEFQQAIMRCKPVQQVWEIVDEQSKKIEELKEIIENQAARIETIEFAVVVKGKEFKVQKKVLAENSPLLAKLIKENEGAEILELQDISQKAFEDILNFMHTKRPPKPSANFSELYAASARLEMTELNDLCVSELMGKVTPNNSLDILNLCDKFQNIDLQKKAHEEYKKKL